MADIAEQICLAVDQIVSERIKSIKFDTTIIATIVDNKYAEQNRYTCSNGSVQFVAFATDTTYKINESVQVTIPNNDYEQQKIIIGRYVAENDIPFTYVQPFNTIIDVSANLVDSTNGNIFSLLANEDYNLSNKNDNGKYDTFPTEIPLWSSTFEENFSDFTRLGIQGQFRSWIANLKAVSGDYGYRLEILSNNGVTIETKDELAILTQWSKLYNNILMNVDYDAKGLFDNTPDRWYDKIKDKFNLSLKEGETFKNAFIREFEAESNIFSEVRRDMVYAMIYAHGQISELFLSTQDMYGDPYNYQSFYTQECVFDISNYKNIMAMSLFFYQTSGSFYDENGDYIPYKSNLDVNFVDNLFTKDPYVCLGYNLSDFDKEQAILYSLNSDTYLTKDGVPVEQSQKTIRLRWLHEYENGEIKVINEESELEGYEVRWYRFYMGAPSPDEYAGVYWKRLEVLNEENKKFAYISNISPFTCVLNPAVNVAQEQIKAIVLYDGNVIRSNIITFYNEKDVASQATTDLMAGLSLWCEDNSYGNYYIYGQNNNLFDDSKANEILTLRAKFTDNSIITNSNVDIDVAVEAPDLTEARTITWEFPLKNTMIVVHGFNYSYQVPEKAQIKDANGRVIGTDWQVFAKEDPDGNAFKLPGYFTGENNARIQIIGNTIYIKREWSGGKDFFGTSLPSIHNYQEYRINKTYNATSINNTVKCTISKDSLNYAATKSMQFGLMGTNGTDATLVINFDDNKTALTAILNRDDNGQIIPDTLGITARLYDFNHNEVDFNNLDLNLKCTWDWYAYHEFTETKEKELYKQYLLDNNIIVPTEESPFELLEANLSADQRRQYRNAALKKHASIKLELTNNGQEINKCFLSHEVDLDINDTLTYDYFLILQATVSGFGDYDLTAFKPIPIRLTPQFRNIIGPTEIIYDSSGHVDYYKEPYELWWVSDLNKVNFVLDTVESQSDIVLYKNDALTWRIYNPYGESAGLIGSIASEANKDKKHILKPAPIYTKNTDPYGVECRALTESGQAEKRCWIQPIMIMSNKYPSSTLNKWNGNEILLGTPENPGAIVAPAIAAGKKNSDNTFSGVMLGDWQNKKGTDQTAEEISAQTGVYGFHHGEQSFGFKEDGTAFIGKSGHGRIIFDGNSGVLKSAAWDAIQAGMFLDLDDGILKMQKNSKYEVVTNISEVYKPGEYYVFKSGYFPVNLNEKWSSSKDYYLFKLQDLGLITQKEFLTKQASNSNQNFYQKNITYEETSVYDNQEDYYIDGFVRVIITRDQYDKSLSEGFSTKYYILKESYALSSEEWSANTIYYTEYTQVTLTKELYDTYFTDGKSTRYYVETENGYELSTSEFVEDGSYWIKEFSKTSVDKDAYDATLVDGVSTKYYIKANSEYIFGANDYTASTEYYMPSKVLKTFINEDDFNTYLANNKIWKVSSISYSVVAQNSLYSETKIYAQYSYQQCYYVSTGPLDQDIWNTRNDPNLIDGIKYKGPANNTNNIGRYYIFSENFELSYDDAPNTNETYYEYNEEQEQRFITLSAQENRFPLAIGTTNAVSQRKFRVEWDGTVWIENGNIQGIITADELYCEYGFIGGWEIDARTLSGGKTILDSTDGIFTNRIGIIDQISSKSGDGLLGEIGLIYGSTGAETTYNIGIISKNQSIVLDTTQAAGSTSNIALRSKTGAWFQCQNFYVMGINGGWMSNAASAQIFADKFAVEKSNTITLKASSSLTLDGAKISIGNSGPTTIGSGNLTITSTTLTVNTSKNNQHGIYARFG